MSLNCRIASLFAFHESRTCDDSDKGPGGQFAAGNDCGGGGGGGSPATGTLTSTAPSPPPARVLPLPPYGSINFNNERLKKSPLFKGAEKLKHLSIDETANVKAVQAALGGAKFGAIAKILVADVEDAYVSITTDLGIVVSQSSVRVDPKDASKGKVSIITSLRFSDPSFVSVEYESFSLDNAAKKSADVVAYANDIMDLMLDSLEQAEESGVAEAATFAAGNRGDREWKGYRLWGKFGFDAVLPRKMHESIPDEFLGAEAMASRTAGEDMTLQQLLATPQGVKWWQRNGSHIKMKLSFTDKESLGYKRFKRLLEARKRHRKRGGEKRSFMQWLYETDDVSERSLIEYRNCGTGAGGFQKGNDCSGDEGKPSVEVPKNVRRQGQQTGVARKLYSMGTTERKVSKLISEIGGDSKSSTVKINGNRVNVYVRDKSGKNLYFMEIRYSGARLYPLEAKGKVSQEDSKRYADSMRKALPQKYNKKTDQDYKVTVMKDPKDFEKWQREDDERIKSIEDKYRFSLELPPHQRPKKQSRSARLAYASLLAFHEARNCGTGAGGFQKGNTCSGAAAASDAAMGAVKGAAAGAAIGGLYGIVPGAVGGAISGAVSGLFRARGEPAKVSGKIAEVGATDESVSSLVKNLEGSPKSTATVKGKKLLLDVKSDSGKPRFSVEIDKTSIVITPKGKTGRLSDSEIKRVTRIAEDFAPKAVQVVVKASDKSLIKKLASKGITVAAAASGVFIAHWTVPAILGEVEGAVGKYGREDLGLKPRRK